MYKDPVLQQIEDEAIQVFGADKIGTRELRIAMPQQEKEKLIQWLIMRYFEKTGGIGMYF